MRKETTAKTSHMVSASGVLICALMVGCATYVPYVVEGSFTQAASLPAVSVPAVAVDPAFTVYQSSEDPTTFFVIPAALTIQQSIGNRAQAMSIERYDGRRLLLFAQLGPANDLLERAHNSLSAVGRPSNKVFFYPIDSLLIHPLTDPRYPRAMSFTVAPELQPNSESYSVLLLLQASGAQTIRTLKQLLSTPNGFVAEGQYSISVKDSAGTLSRENLTLQLQIHDLSITDLTL